MTTPETTIPRRQLFIERYVLERASKFDVGKEKEQAWQATLDAESIYEMFLQRDKGKVTSGQPSPKHGPQLATLAQLKKSANLDPLK